MQKQNGKGAISYAWVILAVLFIGLVATFGMRTSFSVYISPWEHEFSVGRTVVTSISMLNFAVFAIGQPFAGKLNDQLGKSIVPSVSIFLIGGSLLLTSFASQIWQVFLLFGVVFSLGVAGCSNSIPTVIISNWFVEKRGLALGLVTSGMAVGQLVMVNLNLFIIEQLGWSWRTTMLLLSIIIMAVVGPLYMFLLRNKPEEKGLKPYGYKESGNEGHNSGATVQGVEKPLPITGALKMKVFWLISIPYFICGFTDVGLIATHLIPMAEGKGFPVSGVMVAVSLIAIANIVGSIATGHLSDHFSRTRQLALIYSIRAATYVFLIFIQRPWLLTVFAAIYGLVEMASIAPTSSLGVQLFNKYSTGAVIGLIAVSHQIGGAVGSWVPGLLFDLTGSYTVVLVISVALLLVAGWMSLRISETRNEQVSP